MIMLSSRFHRNIDPTKTDNLNSTSNSGFLGMNQSILSLMWISIDNFIQRWASACKMIFYAVLLTVICVHGDLKSSAEYKS